jgi:hypothetical protein
MNRTLIVVSCVAILFMAGAVAWRRTATPASRATSASRAESLPADWEVTKQQQAVGWVFGRMVGFPGADRPLTGQPGSFGGQPLPPRQMSHPHP